MAYLKGLGNLPILAQATGKHVFFLRLLVSMPLLFSDFCSHPWHQGLWRKRKKNDWGK